MTERGTRATHDASAWHSRCTVYPKKYAHGFCFAVLCCGHTLTDSPIFIRLTSLALWQSNDCPSASKATLMNMDKYFMWIHYERLHNHNKAKHNKTACRFLGTYCILSVVTTVSPRILLNKTKEQLVHTHLFHGIFCICALTLYIPVRKPATMTPSNITVFIILFIDGWIPPSSAMRQLMSQHFKRPLIPSAC